MKVRLMKQSDLEGAAEVHRLTFIRQKQSQLWLQCNLNAFPRFLCFVAEENNTIVGYIPMILQGAKSARQIVLRC